MEDESPRSAAEQQPWIYLSCHPAAFTCICTTEIAEMQRNEAEFLKRDCQVVLFSCDPVQEQLMWGQEISALAQKEQNEDLSPPHETSSSSAKPRSLSDHLHATYDEASNTSSHTTPKYLGRNGEQADTRTIR